MRVFLRTFSLSGGIIEFLVDEHFNSQLTKTFEEDSKLHV